MEYIVIPTSDKTETNFFLDLLKKMHKEAISLSAANMEDIAFLAALQESETSGNGNLDFVKGQLSQIAAGK